MFTTTLVAAQHVSTSMATMCIRRLGRSLLFDQRGQLVSNPPTGTPAFSVSGKFVYEHPASSKPRYYLS